MVSLVLRRNTAQDRNRVLNGRLTDENLLETTFQSRVLFDVLAILVQRGRADHAQFATRKHRLEHIARIHRTFRATTGTDDRMKLVDKGDDLPVRALDFFENSLQALLEFTAVFRACHHQCQVESNKRLILQGCRDITRDNTLSQPFNNRGLTHTGLTDEDRVVLRTTRQYLHNATNLRVTTDHRVELAFASDLGQVSPVLLESFEAPLRVRRCNRIWTERLQSFFQSVGRCRVARKNGAGLTL